jgi:hypothetical protein
MNLTGNREKMNNNKRQSTIYPSYLKSFATSVLVLIEIRNTPQAVNSAIVRA